MSKITFRADDDLIEQVEAREASKSEVMREALRAYLEEGGEEESEDARTVDDLIAERVDALVADRLETTGAPGGHAPPARDVNVTITVEPPEGSRVERTETVESAAPRREEPEPARTRACGQCGEPLSDDHVYCPNCGEKASNRVFCECGDELRADWAYCPSCGRRTPSADVLDG